jgi:hypothetical protein
MLPNVSTVLQNWTNATMTRVIDKAAVDFEVKETGVRTKTFEAMLTPMPPQKVDRKPEGDRVWMWWDCLTTELLNLDDQVQDDQGRVFKVSTRADWSRAGYYAYDLQEQPVDEPGQAPGVVFSGEPV